MTALDRFIDEVRADPNLAVHADVVATALRALDFEGDGNTDAVMCFEATLWIVRQNVGIDERVKALHQLFSLPRGPTKVNLRRDGERIQVNKL
jgi:hypothetical protein